LLEALYQIGADLSGPRILFIDFSDLFPTDFCDL